MNRFKNFQILLFDKKDESTRKTIFVNSDLDNKQFHVAVNIENEEVFINENGDKKIFELYESCCVYPADEKLIDKFFDLLLSSPNMAIAISYLSSHYSQEKQLFPSEDRFDILSEINNRLSANCNINVTKPNYAIDSTISGNFTINVTNPSIRIMEGTGVELKIKVINEVPFEITEIEKYNELSMTESLKIKEDSFFLCESTNGYPVLISKKMFEDFFNKK